MSNDATISVRLPEETRKALDEAAARERRSRAFIVKEALDLYLRHPARPRLRLKDRTPDERRAGYQRILALAGAGVPPGGPGRSGEDIDKMIREIRGDDD